MSGYRNYYLWCPNWDPGTPPPIREQVHAYNSGVIYAARAWLPTMCLFESDGGDHFRQGTYQRSSDNEVRFIRDTYRCVNHGNAPEVFRQRAAYDRRYYERRDTVSQPVSLRNHPELIPDGLTLSDRQWLEIRIPRRPDPVTTHTTWATT